MKFPKIKRIVNEEAKKEVREQRCTVCGTKPSEPDHITSRGAGGGDTANNLMPLCRRCHTERHMLGPKRMAQKYFAYKNWLLDHDREDILNG